MIRLRAVGKSFTTADGDTVEALAEASVDIGAGEFVAIVGPSGCGKSTLLRLIAGLIAPSTGEVSIRGERVQEPSTDVGIVFQAPTLLPWADILDNVLFPLRLLGRRDAAGIARARGLLAMAGLGDFEHRMPRELSGGMQQRAAICRALVHEPTILLMDEPFGALDALTREEMALELLRLLQVRPASVVFVTHSIAEAVILADRVVVMTARPGRIADVITVALPRPRDFRQVSMPEYATVAERVRRLIFRRAPASDAPRTAAA